MNQVVASHLPKLLGAFQLISARESGKILGMLSIERVSEHS